VNGHFPLARRLVFSGGVSHQRSAFMLEVLRKHLYREERFDFTSHGIGKEEDYSIEGHRRSNK
jgi:hypothetical protein